MPSFRAALLPRFLALALLSTAACAPAQELLPRGEEPSLVVLLAVDQMRADYLERFRPLFEGGLARLLDEGAVFADAHHEHSMTSTAPGHATLVTGSSPARTGIVGNTWIDHETGESVYAAGPSSERSPALLEVTALGDWLKARDPRSKVFTASAKDRSAVMMGGQDPDGAYWYDQWTGEWRSSSYYRRAARPWLDAFNERRWPDALFGTLWSPLEGVEVPDELGIRALDTGVYDISGPHSLGGMALRPGPSFYGAIYDSPFIDAYLAELARVLVREEELGLDGSPDLLGLSFSALDSVGHDYGPDSGEVLDVLLRLDRLLGELLEYLESEVGRDYLVVGLSADHGVQPLPELADPSGPAARRLGDDDYACVQRAGDALAERLGGGDWFVGSDGGFYLDDEALTALGADPAEVEDLAADLLEQCDAIRKVWTNAELAAASSSEPDWQRFKASYFPSRSPDLTLQFEPYFLYQSGLGTTHGSPYDYDSQVPFVIWAPGVDPAAIDTRVATVDMAPTLARLAGIEPPPGLDGVDRTPLLGR